MRNFIVGVMYRRSDNVNIPAITLKHSISACLTSVRTRPALIAALLCVASVTTVTIARGQSSQNPSPMIETTRMHERVESVVHPGSRREVDAGLPAPIQVFIPDETTAGDLSLLVHFMGAAHVPEDAVAKTDFHDVLAVVNLGSGSNAFERPLRDGAFDRVLKSVEAEVANVLGGGVRIAHVDVSAFSAGYGAVRAILSEGGNAIHGVLLLDALHSGYIPEGQPVAQGGRLDTTLLTPFAWYAERAIMGEKALVITHSEVFPGTFASTTETSDYILEAVGLARKAVLRWGPVGMQQLSEAGSGRFRVLGFAGNSAPDHMDHLHGMAGFLPLLHAENVRVELEGGGDR